MTNSALDSASFPELHEALRKLVLERAYTRSDEPFVLSSGGTSHDYVDMRRGMSNGDALAIGAAAVIAAMAEHAVAFDAIGGMTMGADPVAHAVALVGSKRWFSVRKGERSHGTGQRIEGALLDKETRTVVFEDTVSTGRSLIDALDVVETTGTTIVAAVTLLDRGDSAEVLLAERSIAYFPLLTYRDLGIVPIAGPPT